MPKVRLRAQLRAMRSFRLRCGSTCVRFHRGFNTSIRDFRRRPAQALQWHASIGLGGIESSAGQATLGEKLSLTTREAVRAMLRAVMV